MITLKITKAQAAAVLRAIELLAIEYEDCRTGGEPFPPQAPAKFWDILERARLAIAAVLAEGTVK